MARLLCPGRIQHFAAVTRNGLVRHFDAGVLVQHHANRFIRRFAFAQRNDGFFHFVQPAIFFRRGRRVVLGGFSEACLRFGGYDWCIHNFWLLIFLWRFRCYVCPLWIQGEQRPVFHFDYHYHELVFILRHP